MEQIARQQLVDTLNGHIMPHRKPLKTQLLQSPGLLLQRFLTVKAATLAVRLQRGRDMSRRMFYGEDIRFPFPACWDLAVYRSYIDEAELRLLKYLILNLPSGGQFLDVGANIGLMSQVAAKVMGPDGRVYAFEPGAQALSYCKDNVARFPQVQIVAKAAMDAPGELTFFEGTGACMVSSSTVEAHFDGRDKNVREVTIEATTLDDFCASEAAVPDVIKIDVEGAELSVLKGARRVLETIRPSVVLEVSFKPEEFEELYQPPIRLLQEAGYVAHAIGPNGTPHAISNAFEEHAKQCTFANGYLHVLDNLLFLHPEGRASGV
ncbi:FkbM family methyltransferase [Primorskyibacter sp. S187A]|uniref:FkbM family methyltransferase n=1 Tax=Primorskyibacter sp. S187A TaxID=3415130 RepID=UPI003C7E1A22